MWICGLVLVLIEGWNLGYRLLVRRKGKQVLAEVVQMEKHCNSEGDRSYTVVFSYMDGGNQVVVRDDATYHRPKYAAGQRVEIIVWRNRCIAAGYVTLFDIALGVVGLAAVGYALLA